jgi:hypothetical protein
MSTVLPPTPTPTQLRDELERLVLNELLGPAGNPDEELNERSVRDRYLVGILAPVKQRATSERPDKAPDGDETAYPPAMNDDRPDGGTDTEDGTTELSPTLPQVTFPSSFGITFGVDLGTAKLKVRADWGQYLRENSEHLTNEKNGNPLKVWKRYQRSGVTEINLKAGTIKMVAIDPASDEVYLRGLVRKRDNHWIVTLFLVNGQDEPTRCRDESWLFQAALEVEAPDESPVFVRKVGKHDTHKMDPQTYADEQAMEMLYRNYVEFAVGHGVSVHVTPSDGNPKRAVKVATRAVPSYEIRKTTPPDLDDESINPAFAKLEGLVLDMRELAETPQADYRKKLEPIVISYKEWIEAQSKRISDPTEDLSEYKTIANEALDRCRGTLNRIKLGIDLLESDEKAAEAFQFANRAMWLQRTHSILSAKVRGGEDTTLEDVDIEKNRKWYPFQLAFILLNLPGSTKLDHPERSMSKDAIADLLWFATGGGKTEAYLGLAAYTMGLRRLQGTIEGRSGDDGVAVLMRYTLRLLTLQQFQRAAALICACESIRLDGIKKNDFRWGKSPFRLGLWVGRRTTPNTNNQSSEAIKQDHDFRSGAIGGEGSPYQLMNCPWCGKKIKNGPPDLRIETFAKGRCRTLIFCGDKLGRCLFSAKNSPDEGLPVLVVDEEIYRRLPTMLITTVDKFAQMPWNGAVQMLFGQVDGYCERHGFRSPEINDTDQHRKYGKMPAAKTIAHKPVRPVDLIIQDELHLISGPLGSLVGLYETALDRLCTWEVDGKKVRPKVIASTATIRKAADQIHALFLRKVNVFPPHGLDVEDNFFSVQRPAGEEYPGRKYIGICSPGRRLKAALIRVYTAYLSAGQVLYREYGRDADAWMTLVGYFNSLRELGGMRRLVDDDVRTRLGKMDQRGLASRKLTPNSVVELTSRIGSTQIPEILESLEDPFDPALESKRIEMAKKKQYDEMPPKPFDVLLATNMISVGVDIGRLGLMVVGGQPKTTAEYIQATSRVGRRWPGLVCTIYNWARPRDLSHYEHFEHYHATFYNHVEALSVTPFSPGALSRGLAALLVSCLRLENGEFNPNDAAMKMASKATDAEVRQAIEDIARRAELVGPDGKRLADLVRAELKEKLDYWQQEAQNTEAGRILCYHRKADKEGVRVSLLSRPGMERWESFTCLNSLREVEPTARLILDERPLDYTETTAPDGDSAASLEEEGE